MTDLPGRENDPNENPFAMFGDPEQMAAAMRQFADMLSAPPGSGPVNWDMAKNIARHAVVAEGDPSVMEGERRQIVDALRLADLWLDEATALPSGVPTPRRGAAPSGSRRPFPVWKKLCDPVAERMVETMSGTLGAARPARRGAGHGRAADGHDEQMGGMMVGQQIGQALGALAGEVVGSTDIGLPLSDNAALLPGGIAAFGQGLEIPPRRSGCISPCARPPTSGCSRTCRGCARICSAPSRGTPGASRSTRPRWRSRSAGSTSTTPSSSRRR